MLAAADITVDGPKSRDIRVYDDRFYERMMKDRNLGLGDSYMEGWWDCDRVDKLICHLLRSGIEEKIRESLRYLIRFLPAILFNLQSRLRTPTDCQASL